MAACPCEVVAPCSETCGCAFPDRSTTCRRCATFGAEIERIRQADLLTTLIDNSAQVGRAIQEGRRGITFLNFVVACERQAAGKSPSDRGSIIFSLLRNLRPDLAVSFKQAAHLNWRDEHDALTSFLPEFWRWLGDNWAITDEVPS